MVGLDTSFFASTVVLVATGATAFLVTLVPGILSIARNLVLTVVL